MDSIEAEKAIKKGVVGRIRNLLDSGGDANLSNHLGWTLPMLAAHEGNSAIGRELIGDGAGLDSGTSLAILRSPLLRIPDIRFLSNYSLNRETLYKDTRLVPRSRAF